MIQLNHVYNSNPLEVYYARLIRVHGSTVDKSFIMTV